MNVYLIGFMGVGKTTVGLKLAEELGYEFVDTDEIIEHNEAMSISDIFENKGEEYFRRLETDVIEKLSKKDRLVVSCGGGVIKNEDNVKLMKKSGSVILLEASAEVIYHRVKDFNNRPLLKGRKNIKGIQELLDERQPLYDKACTHRIQADKSVNKIVSEMLIIC